MGDKAFNIVKSPKYGGYQHVHASMVCIFFDRKSSDGAMKSEIMPNQQLAEELHKTIIRKSESN